MDLMVGLLIGWVVGAISGGLAYMIGYRRYTKVGTPSASHNSAMTKLLERWLYPSQRGDIMDLTHDTKRMLKQLRQ
jgi:hypothetical protein